MVEVFVMDGRTWDIVVESIEQQGAVTDTDKSGRSLTGRMHRDIIGTFYNYTMIVSPKKNNYTEFDEFYTAITAPIESHMVSFPHNQSMMTFDAYITNANRPLKRMTENFNRWGKMTVNFIAMSPQIPFGG